MRYINLFYLLTYFTEVYEEYESDGSQWPAKTAVHQKKVASRQSCCNNNQPYLFVPPLNIILGLQQNGCGNREQMLISFSSNSISCFTFIAEVPQPKTKQLTQLVHSSTVGLTSHWPCGTGFSGLSTYGLMAKVREMSTPPTPIRAWSALPLPFYTVFQKKKRHPFYTAWHLAKLSQI